MCRHGCDICDEKKEEGTRHTARGWNRALTAGGHRGVTSASWNRRVSVCSLMRSRNLMARERLRTGAVDDDGHSEDGRV